TAARFAADPDQAIADANLTNVTSADVEALIPVVTESMSSLVTDMPAVAGLDGLGEAATNVWASGAATAAFDAFGDEVPAPVIDDTESLIADRVDAIDEPDEVLQSGLDMLDDTSDVSEVPIIDDIPIAEPYVGSDGDDTVVDVDPQASGFDIF
ncbi:Rv0340 family IniB-related protein, partial [Mycolicibacterium elephantis]